MKMGLELRVQGSLLRVRATGRCVAFTLVELLTSIAILLILVGMLTVTFNTASNTWRAAEREVERFQDARAALDLISRDLQQVYVSSNAPFYGTSSSLAFVATVNDTPTAADLAEVVYLLNRAETPQAPFRLYRRLTRSTTNDVFSSGPIPYQIVPNPRWDFYSNPSDWPNTVDYTNSVCDNVISFALEYRMNDDTASSFWNSTPFSPAWEEPKGSGSYAVQFAGPDERMTNLPPAYIDVRLRVVDSKTAALLRQSNLAPAAWTNLVRQASRRFAVIVPIPQR
jgi:type II secretory pathway pseudopilin PulG